MKRSRLWRYELTRQSLKDSNRSGIKQRNNIKKYQNDLQRSFDFAVFPWAQAIHFSQP